MLPLFTNLKYRQFPWVTCSLMGLNIAVFIFEMALRDLGVQHAIVRHWTYTVGKAEIAFATGYPDLVFHALASVFVAMFLHVSFVHLATNMTFLFALGPALEAQLGRVKFLCFYLAAGICATLYYQAGGSTGDELLGASGALGGLVGAYLVLWPRARITCFMGFRLMTSNALVLLLDFVALQVAAYYFGVGQSADAATGVAYSAHIGGLLCGVLFAAALRMEKLVRPSVGSDAGIPRVVMAAYEKELYDRLVDWLEGCLTKCWRIVVWCVFLPVRKFRTKPLTGR